MTTQSIKIALSEQRIDELEGHYEELNSNVSQILTLRLPSIEQKLERLDTKISIMTVFNVGAIIVAILVNKFLT